MPTWINLQPSAVTHPAEAEQASAQPLKTKRNSKDTLGSSPDFQRATSQSSG